MKINHEGPVSHTIIIIEGRPVARVDGRMLEVERIAWTALCATLGVTPRFHELHEPYRKERT